MRRSGSLHNGLLPQHRRQLNERPSWLGRRNPRGKEQVAEALRWLNAIGAAIVLSGSRSALGLFTAGGQVLLTASPTGLSDAPNLEFLELPRGWARFRPAVRKALTRQVSQAAVVVAVRNATALSSREDEALGRRLSRVSRLGVPELVLVNQIDRLPRPESAAVRLPQWRARMRGKAWFQLPCSVRSAESAVRLEKLRATGQSIGLAHLIGLADGHSTGVPDHPIDPAELSTILAEHRRSSGLAALRGALRSRLGEGKN